MKHVNSVLKITSTFILLFFVFTSISHAQNTKEDGFYGQILLGGEYSTGDLSLDDASESDNKTITSLNQSPKSNSEFYALIMGGIGYHFSSTNIDVSLGMENGFGINVQHYAGDLGFFTAGIYYSKEDVWADPFLINSARSETDRKALGYEIGWEMILETPLSLNYNLETIDIENDIAGKRNSRLKREGNIHNINASYGLFENNKHEVMTQLDYTIGDLDGSAMAYKGYGVSLSHIFHGNGWDIETTGSFTKNRYDGIHQKFNKERDDSLYQIESAFTYYNPFGFKNYFVTAFVSYGEKDSNINFYDQSLASTGIGIGYNF